MLGQKCQVNSRKLANPFDNNIYLRITQLSQILTNNNTLFIKATPSEQQLKQILQHIYNCYDQLDFIYLDYSKQQIHYLDPKALSLYTQKIFRSTKCLLKHLQYWYEAFSLQIVKKTNQTKHNLQHYCTHSHCFICLKNINQMKLKEARESILGPEQWRQIYEEELRDEQQELKKIEMFSKREEKQEYVSSVNFLARIIKEMEDSAKNYEKLAQTVERQNANQEHTIFVLQELIGKLKVKLGNKYKLKFENKLKSMLKKMEEKNNSLNVAHQMAVKQQFNLKIEQGEQKTRANGVFIQETTLHKLKEENKRLISQRNELYDRLELFKQSQLKKQINSNFLRSVLKKKTFKSKDQKTEEQKKASSQANKGGNILLEKIEKIENQQKSASQQRTIQSLSMQTKKRGKKNIVGRMSAFHLKRIQTHNSQLSEFMNKTIEESNVDQEFEQKLVIKEQENNRFNLKNPQLGNSEAEHRSKIQIACQWEQSFCDLVNGREVDNVISDFQKKKPTTTRVQKENEEITPTLGTKKSLVADNLLPRYNSSDSNYLRGQSSATLHQENFLSYDHIQKPSQQLVKSMDYDLRKENIKQKAVKLFQNIQQGLKDKKSDKKNRFTHQKAGRTSKDNLGVLVKNAKLQKKVQTKNNLTLDQIKLEHSKDEKMNYFKAKVVTQQSVPKKQKIIRNVVFKPEHLIIFGGVSESYNYQNWKTDFSIDIFTNAQQMVFSGLKNFIQNLKNFKNGFYENIVCFLSRPFSTIQKNEVQFQHLSNQLAEKLLVKMFLFHKKKCGLAICGHMRHFCEIIGYYLKQ